MKHLSFCFTLILFLSNCLLASSQSVTLEECQRMAKENYPTIVQFNIIEQTKSFDIKNANTSYLPQLSIGGQATWQSEVTKVDIDIDIPGVELPIPNKDQYKVIAEMSQMIWDGGLLLANKHVILANAEVQRRQLHSDLYTLQERINNIFFGALLLEERMVLHQVLESELQRNYKKIESYVANGIANEADLSVVKVELLKSKQDRIEIESSLKAYRKMLSIFIGKEISEDTYLVKPDIIDILNNRTVNRPELDLFKSQKQLLDAQKKTLLAKNMPQVGAFVQGGYGSPALNMFDNRFRPFVIGGIKLSWNFGNLYTLSNDKKKINLLQATVDSNRDTFMQNISIHVSQQQIEVDKYREIMRDDDEIIRLRKVVRESAEAKMENGTITVSEMMKEVAAEDAAKQAKALHEIQFLMAIYQLKYTTN